MFSKNLKIIDPNANPDPFSPDNDSIKDKIIISFTSSKYRAAWKVEIINPLDSKVVREFSGLIKNKGKDISISWDGRDSLGNLLPDMKYEFRIILKKDNTGPGISHGPTGSIKNPTNKDKTPPLINITGVLDNHSYPSKVIPIIKIQEKNKYTTNISLNRTPLTIGTAVSK